MTSTSYYPKTNLSGGAKWIKHLTRDRLSTFLGGHFSGVNLSSKLFTHRADSSNEVEGQPAVRIEVWSAPGLTKPGWEDVFGFPPSEQLQTAGDFWGKRGKEWRSVGKGETLGPSWTNHWWKVEVNVPGEWWAELEMAGEGGWVQFEFDPSSEALVYTASGHPLQGITGGFGGDRRVEYILPRGVLTHRFVIESSCNGMFGVPQGGDTIAPPDPNRQFTLNSADLVVPNASAWALLADFITLKEIVETLPGDTPLQNAALTAANAIMNAFGSGSVEEIKKCRDVAQNVFGALEKTEKEEEGGEIWAIGHCHIDTAWLWPYRTTQQKIARSWATQLDLITRYPEFTFAASSAQQYKWLLQLYPTLFEELRREITGQRNSSSSKPRFEPTGGSWVEFDANMPSGEALVRQFLFGQRFFERHFGKRSGTAWLPDSFGVTGALPQIVRGSGMSGFFTQKLSWNNM